jgi:hypothetical protein
MLYGSVGKINILFFFLTRLRSDHFSERLFTQGLCGKIFYFLTCLKKKIYNLALGGKKEGGRERGSGEKGELGRYGQGIGRGRIYFSFVLLAPLNFHSFFLFPLFSWEREGELRKEGGGKPSELLCFSFFLDSLLVTSFFPPSQAFFFLFGKIP